MEQKMTMEGWIERMLKIVRSKQLKIENRNSSRKLERQDDMTDLTIPKDVHI